MFVNIKKILQIAVIALLAEYAQASIIVSPSEELSLYATPEGATQRVESVWFPLLEPNSELRESFKVADSLRDLSSVVKHLPSSHAVVILPWFETSGALNHFSSIRELISAIQYLSSYPLDSFARVTRFIEGNGLLPKCGLGNQLEYIFRFSKSYTQNDLDTLQQIFREAGMFDKLQTGEQAAYLLKDFVQDESVIRDVNLGYSSPTVYPLAKLKEVIRFLHGAGIIEMCRDGVVLRDMIASLRYFDFTVFNNPKKRLQDGSYLLFLMALKNTKFWEKRFEEVLIRQCRSNSQSAQIAEQIFGPDSPLTLDYYKQAVASDIDNLVCYVHSDPKASEALKERLANSLVRIHNLAAAKHLRGYLSTLRSTNFHYLKHAIPTMLKILDRGIYLDQEGFERVLANLCCINRYTYEELEPLILGEDLIGLCGSKTDLIRIFFALSDFSQNVSPGLVQWFKHHKIRKRLFRANDFLDVLSHINALFKEGVRFSEGVLDVSQIKGSYEIGAALRFLEIEEMFLTHGDQAVYSPAFGDVLSKYLHRLRGLENVFMSDFPVSAQRTHSGQWSGRHPPIRIVNNNAGYRGVDDKIIIRPEDTMLSGKAFTALIPEVEGKPEAVGYNVCLPGGGIKAVCVETYGGYDSLKDAYGPGHIDYKMSYLLSHGVAYITLNLADLLRLKVFQAYMPEELHTALHGSIHAFYQILKDRPEQLHPELAQLKGKPLFLYGASFGGGHVVRHSKLFPNTFNGYISHDGKFSYFHNHLNALLESGINNISPKDSFLVLHNFDDRCVSNHEAFSMYRELKNRDVPVKLFVADRGNPMLRKKRVETSLADHEQLDENSVYKGHFMPLQKELYVKTIHDFIANGARPADALSDWRLLRYSDHLYRSRYKMSPDCMVDIFVCEAKRLYRESMLARPNGVIDPAAIRLRKNREASWEAFYEPLLRATANLVYSTQPENISTFSVPEEHLTDENIDRTLNWFLPILVDYLYETDEAFSSLGLDSLKFRREVQNIISPALREEYRRLIRGSHRDVNKVLICSWILSNPQLAPKENPLLNSENFKQAKFSFLSYVEQDSGLRKAVRFQKVLSAAQLIREQNLQALDDSMSLDVKLIVANNGL